MYWFIGGEVFMEKEMKKEQALLVEMTSKNMKTGEMSGRTTYEYDEKGCLLKVYSEYVIEDGSVAPFESVYEHDEDGLVIKRIDYNQGEKTGDFLYKYDSQGRLESVHHDKDGNRIGYILHEYFEGREKVLYYDNKAVLYKQIEMYYDDRKRLLAQKLEKDISPDGSSTISLSIYDPHSEKVLAGSHIEKDDQKYMFRNELYKDEEGNVIKILSFIGNNTEPDHETVYKYVKRNQL